MKKGQQNMQRIILIHGFACDSHFWKPQVSALSKYNLRIPDLPYHGGPTDGVEKTLEGLFEWLVRTHLQTPAVLVGHSLGGMIALQIVHDHLELVKGIVLVDSFPSLELNDRFLPGHNHKPVDHQLQSWIKSTRLDIVNRMPQETYDEIWPSVHDFDARPWLSAINCPVLGIYGGRGSNSQNDAEQLKNNLCLNSIAGTVAVTIVPLAGHFVNLEYPEAVNAALTDWLRLIK